jgi:hypothetical protein
MITAQRRFFIPGASPRRRGAVKIDAYFRFETGIAAGLPGHGTNTPVSFPAIDSLTISSCCLVQWKYD